jgi:hypothetical protein
MPQRPATFDQNFVAQTAASGGLRLSPWLPWSSLRMTTLSIRLFIFVPSWGQRPLRKPHP